MKEKKKPLSTDSVKLRHRGEERLKESATETDQPLTNGDTQKLLHELQLYQVELEMQNEELKGARETIEAGLAKYSELYDFAPVGYFTFDRNGAILQVNATGAGILGIEQSLMVTQLFEIFISQADRAVFRSFLQKVFEGEEKRPCELMLLTKNKEPLYARIDACILRDGRECLATVVDISERKQAELTLRESEEIYRSIFTAAKDAIVILEHETGRVLDVNSFACSLYGYTREEMLGMRNIDLSAEPDKTASGLKAEVEWIPLRYHKKKDGSVFPVEISVSYIRINQKGLRISTSVMRDISERLRAEEALDRLKRKNELILNSAGDGILGLSSEGRHTFVNHAAAHMLGYEAAELIGRSSHSTWHLRREDGTPHPEDECPIQLSIRNGTVHREMGDMFCRKDGSGFPVEYSCNPVFEGEKSVGAVVVFKDISERRKAEREREVLDTQLRQAQKMEAIGSLAGGIAHDFNNILGAIMGFTDMALDEIKEGSLARQDLEQVRKASHRARDLVTQILAFSRQGETRERRPVEMGPIVKEALKLMRATLPATIEIKRKIPKKPRVVIADQTQIHQIIVNLCTNAAHAMSERGGILEVTMADVELDAAGDIAYPNLKPGSYLRLSVRDTGHGMDGATLERIFDPYFTTKRVGEGSGLGLAVVHGIVQRHEGAVSVESDPGKGTVFHILFPKVESAPERDGKGLFPMREGSERILFVDDEEALVTLSERMLRSLGYNVTVETNGIEALDLFRAQPDAFDLIITDYTMPHMTGIELAREILRIRPDIPIILCTGFSAGVNAEKAREAGIREFAMKPLIMSTISEAIRKALSLD